VFRRANGEFHKKHSIFLLHYKPNDFLDVNIQVINDECRWFNPLAMAPIASLSSCFKVPSRKIALDRNNAYRAGKTQGFRSHFLQSNAVKRNINVCHSKPFLQGVAGSHDAGHTSYNFPVQVLDDRSILK
jgi:hypothetical protein